MSGNKTIDVIFDTREKEEGKAWNSLIDQVNEVLKAGGQYRDINITQWELFYEDKPAGGEKGIHIPFYRHFYHNAETNTIGGGFLLFEVLEDLNRYYRNVDLADDMLNNADLVFTVSVTLM